MPTHGQRCVNPIPRPKLKHLGHAQFKRNLICAIACSLISGIAVRTMYVDPRRRKIDEYYL